MFDGFLILGLLFYKVVCIGFGFVFEGCQIFFNLLVWENLVVTVSNCIGNINLWILDCVFELFSVLVEWCINMGNQFLGGEQ